MPINPSVRYLHPGGQHLESLRLQLCTYSPSADEDPTPVRHQTELITTTILSSRFLKILQVFAALQLADLVVSMYFTLKSTEEDAIVRRLDFGR